MAFLETHVFSQALEVAVTVNVLLPEPSQGMGLEGAKAQEPAPGDVPAARIQRRPVHLDAAHLRGALVRQV